MISERGVNSLHLVHPRRWKLTFCTNYKVLATPQESICRDRACTLGEIFIREETAPYRTQDTARLKASSLPIGPPLGRGDPRNYYPEGMSPFEGMKNRPRSGGSMGPPLEHFRKIGRLNVFVGVS